MAEIDNIVEIFITRETTAIDTASFSIPLVLASFTNFSERTRTYTDIDEVGEDFDSTDNAYILAQKLFSGEGIKPSTIVIGRRQIDSVTGSINTIANNTAYTVTINDTAYTITSDASATADEIVAALDIAVTDVDINFTDNLDGTFTVAPVVPGDNWSITASVNISLVNATPTETWTDALEAVEDDNSTWYAMVAETHVPAEVVELATAIQSRRKIYGTSTQDANFTSGTHIGQLLSDQSLGRTFWVYTPAADTQYPEAAWMSEQLPETPGSNTWNLKQAAGVTVGRITPTQRTNIRGFNGNMYTRVAGVDVFQDGVMADGEFIDVIIFIDWVYARLQEAIFFRLINSRKIPYTRAGATIIENEIRSVLSLGVTNGGIADAPAYTVTAPDPLNIPATMRAQRTMGDFLFEFRLAGAVHKVVVRGTAGV
jgi:hypothetical protein